MKKVAYFTMEIGLNSHIPTYSGGLGVLAGDTIKSAADRGLNVVAVTLLYNRGFFNQIITPEGRQESQYTHFDPRHNMKELPERVCVSIEGRDVSVRAWQYDVKGRTGHVVPVLFLDTNGVNAKRPWDEGITDTLYHSEHDYHKITQRMVLGIGGVRMLQKLGYDVGVHHMNEGHSAFLTAELLRQLGDPNKVKERCVFTTHTPVAAGHDVFKYEDIDKIIEWGIRKEMWRYAGQERVNMTQLALNLSRYANGVSKKHGEVSRMMFPGYNIDFITNGVHSATWTSPAMQEVFDRFCPLWREDPTYLRWIGQNPESVSAITQAHRVAQSELFGFIEGKTGISLDPGLLTVGFARRAAGYKRGNLLFDDLERLQRIAAGKAQFVFAGKAHPSDEVGKGIIYDINGKLRTLKGVQGVYLPDYDMRQGALLTAGVDVWLNNPEKPMEASGTSGMKAAHNGVPTLSTFDGWWIEGEKEGVTGWTFGGRDDTNDWRGDAADLHRKLEHLVGIYGTPTWREAMVGSISHVASFFNTHRMVGEYAQKAYPSKSTGQNSLEGMLEAAA